MTQRRPLLECVGNSEQRVSAKYLLCWNVRVALSSCTEQGETALMNLRPGFSFGVISLADKQTLSEKVGPAQQFREIEGEGEGEGTKRRWRIGRKELGEKESRRMEKYWLISENKISCNYWWNVLPAGFIDKGSVCYPWFAPRLPHRVYFAQPPHPLFILILFDWLLIQDYEFYCIYSFIALSD